MREVLKGQKGSRRFPTFMKCHWLVFPRVGEALRKHVSFAPTPTEGIQRRSERRSTGIRKGCVLRRAERRSTGIRKGCALNMDSATAMVFSAHCASPRDM